MLGLGHGFSAAHLANWRFWRKLAPNSGLRAMTLTYSTLRFVLICILLFCAWTLAPATAVAGSVYKCAGPNGQIAFTNKPSTFSHCKAITTYADAPRAPAATTPHSEYRSEPGASPRVATTANPATSTATAPPADALTQIHSGAVYKVVKANGNVEYTNIRPGRGAYQVLFTYIATCYACNVHSNVNWLRTALNTQAYHEEIAAAAKQYGVDPALLRAVIHAESAFNPNAISNKGAQGLMQLMPGTASDLGVSNAFDAGQNIRGGAQYLAQLLKQFDGDERRATAAYNAGPQNVQKYNGVPPFDETRVYVDRVATLLKRYRAAESPPVAAAAAASVPVVAAAALAPKT